MTILVFLCGLPFSAGAQRFEAFLEQHCITCHGPKKVKGDFRLDTLSRDFQSGKDSHLWAEVLERINSGEMPPEDEPQPSEAEITTVIEQLDQKISEGKASRMAARSKIAHYRLSRKEYQNTIYDLLGVRYDPTQPGELNADSLWRGFERIGSELTLSPSHVERYFQAADTVLSRAFPPTPIETKKVRKTAAEIRYYGGKRQQEYLNRFGIKRPLRSLMFPGRLEFALQQHWLGRLGPESSGLYKAKMQVSGVRPKGGQIPHLRIGQKLGEVANEGLVELDILAPEDEPKIVEFEVYLDMPTNLFFNVIATEDIDRRKGAHHRNHLGSPDNMFTHSSETRLLSPVAPMMFDDQGEAIYSMVLLDWIEWEGPITTKAELALRENILPSGTAPIEEVTQYLQVFAQRAWRRPVDVKELTPYLDSYQSEIDLGESVQSSFQVALLGILTSRNYTYLVEGDIEPRQTLNDYELASRLSYFLWSSMPDEALFSLAEKGQLNGDNLSKTVDRMLDDKKINRFLADFPRQWLQLHKLGAFPPDKKLYPDYDVWLEKSMHREVEHFFQEVFNNNQSILQFIDSNWTMANPRLREFYQLPISNESGFNRIELPKNTQRGGLLTTGAILGLTSDGTRHRPVHRGVWLSETIFASTPPEPPANVDPIEPNPVDSQKSTIRQKLAAHTHDKSCAACHKRIDPLGLAFDQYDAIGQWRTHEKVAAGLGEDPKADASGQLPDGREFANAAEFKKLLLDDKDRFLKAFVSHLATYSLRRVLTIDDEADIDIIVEQAKQQNYQLRDIVKAVATSELLRKR